MTKRPAVEDLDKSEIDVDISKIQPRESVQSLQIPDNEVVGNNPLQMIPVQQSQLPKRVSFMNQIRQQPPEEIGTDQKEIWDREIDDQQMDHFGFLVKNIGKKRDN